ncbi:hypothetical protein BLA23254_04718 [Burkholderia lata]|uniref:Uncharacterized protein n=1 Tax=Burkholderia lata (strain ATCC 17760 / DSM 23089 / LMG 22485 / NCIMB 9086 / R18194 / 383) TaxID=482957 RepID=A0A6P2NX69_BURL3|nr:DUF1826 domain-containing protein [Burkholderia lata]VWB99134.1 hypothetical protein BLA23254_04718 [Burkholderia lata]
MYSLPSYTIDQVGEICALPHTSDSAILIDFQEWNTPQAALQALVEALPDDYTLHIVGTEGGKRLVHYGEHRDRILSDLRRHVGSLPVLQQLSAEIDKSLELFHAVTDDAYPMISLRIITQGYLERESPSVSEKYHRDSTSLTLTKCFFGSGAVYTDDANVRRDFFLRHSIAVRDEDAVLDTTREYTVPDERWVLLKGEIWQGIDARSQSLIDYILGPRSSPLDAFKGRGFIHKGGCLRYSSRRLVFNLNSWKTDFRRRAASGST